MKRNKNIAILSEVEESYGWHRTRSFDFAQDDSQKNITKTEAA